MFAETRAEAKRRNKIFSACAEGENFFSYLREGLVPSPNFPKNQAKRVDIEALIKLFLVEHFGCHPKSCSLRSIGILGDLSFGKEKRKPRDVGGKRDKKKRKDTCFVEFPFRVSVNPKSVTLITCWLFTSTGTNSVQK
jgi:hypothetical protein